MHDSGNDAASSDPKASSVWWGRLANLVRWSTAVLGMVSVAGLAGRFGWIFELASHFRTQLFWGLVVGSATLLMVRCRRSAAIAALLAAVQLGGLWPFYATATSPKQISPNLRVVSLNVHSGNRRHADVIRFIRDTSPDVVVFLEVNDAWAETLATLKDDWPHFVLKPRPGNFGIALYSRVPLAMSRVEFLSEQCPAIAAQIDVEGTPVWVVGAHPYPPMTPGMAARRNEQLAALANVVNELAAEKIVVGDLNTTSWSPAFTDLLQGTGLRDSRIGFGVQPTWQADWLPPFRIPIDHCLVSDQMQVTGRAIGRGVGSDHLPVIVDLAVGVNR